MEEENEEFMTWVGSPPKEAMTREQYMKDYYGKGAKAKITNRVHSMRSSDLR